MSVSDTQLGMESVFTYRGRILTPPDIEFIRALILRHPTASRRALSKKLCEAWGWVQPNGALRDFVCRSMMLALHRAGHIELPPVRYRPPNPLVRRAQPAPVEVDTTPIQTDLAGLGSLKVRQVRRTDDEPLFNSLIETHHYLGYVQPVGEQVKGGRWRVWPCRRRRGIWVRGIATSAGRPRRASRTSASWPTTAAS
jgi:hypothetical protein